MVGPHQEAAAVADFAGPRPVAGVVFIVAARADDAGVDG